MKSQTTCCCCHKELLWNSQAKPFFIAPFSIKKTLWIVVSVDQSRNRQHKEHNITNCIKIFVLYTSYFGNYYVLESSGCNRLRFLLFCGRISRDRGAQNSTKTLIFYSFLFLISSTFHIDNYTQQGCFNSSTNWGEWEILRDIEFCLLFLNLGLKTLFI